MSADQQGSKRRRRAASDDGGRQAVSVDSTGSFAVGPAFGPIPPVYVPAPDQLEPAGLLRRALARAGRLSLAWVAGRLSALQRVRRLSHAPVSPPALGDSSEERQSRPLPDFITKMPGGQPTSS
jgi:hypothetical protein